MLWLGEGAAVLLLLLLPETSMSSQKVTSHRSELVTHTRGSREPKVARAPLLCCALWSLCRRVYTQQDGLERQAPKPSLLSAHREGLCLAPL